MTVKEDYDNLQVGDVVSFAKPAKPYSEATGTIFYFEDVGKERKVPVVSLKEESGFGVRCGTKPFEKRLEALVKAGLPSNSLTYRIFEHDFKAVASKAKNNPPVKLQTQDLASLKINDIVTIDNIDYSILTLELNGHKTPWIKTTDQSKGVFPCAGDCHSGNRKLNLDYDQKYQSLTDLLSFKKDIFVKLQNNQDIDDNTSSKQNKIYDRTSEEREEIVNQKSEGTFVEMIKSDAAEAAYRTAAKKGVRALRAAMLRVAKDKGADRKEVNYLRKAFESDLGEAVLSMALGYMLTYAPLPEAVKNNKHFGRIVGELRIGGIQIGMDTILTEAMGYIGPVLDEIKNLLPEDNEEITIALPARIAKPTTKRIKTSPKEDLDELQEEDMPEKVAKKA